MAGGAPRNGEPMEEVLVCKSSKNKADALFDEIIGHIQEIMLDDGFNLVQRGFMEKHYHHFDDTEENKFIYTDIFKQYTELVETYLNDTLKKRVPDFTMEDFMKTLKSRKDEVGEEILDILLSFSDFLAFKQAILDYKAEKEGVSMDLGGLTVSSLSSMLQDRENSDGFA